MVLQSELEDLCFAVVSPHEYRGLRNELDRLWGLDSLPGVASAEGAAKEASRDDAALSSSSLLLDGSQHSGSKGTSSTSEQKSSVAVGSSSMKLARDNRSSADLSLTGSSDSSSENACSKVKQSPSGVALKLAESPAASSREATAVLDTRRGTAEADSRAASRISSASSAQASASKLAPVSSSEAPARSLGSRELGGSSIGARSTPRMVQDPLDPLPLSAISDQQDRVNSSASASSSGRGQAPDMSAPSRLRSPKANSRRQLTSRKEHWAAKAAAAVVAEASRVTVSRDSAKRNLRRPPSLKLTADQLEVFLYLYSLAIPAYMRDLSHAPHHALHDRLDKG